MLENHPVLKDRLTACGVFAGIGVAAVAGLEMIIGGGFDIITPGREIQQVAPSSYVTITQPDWFSDARVTPLASTEPLFVGEAYAADARLIGSADDPAAPDAHYPDVREDEVARHAEALYTDTARSDYTTTPTSYAQADDDAPAITDAEAYGEDEFNADDTKRDNGELSASETASPW